MLESLQIENYKSLHKVDVQLPPFAVLVGANAAGKTNFVDAIEFLSLIAQTGLPTAVTSKGGYDNICFRRARRAKAAIRFALSASLPVRWAKDAQLELRFDFSFAFRALGGAIKARFAVEEERLCMTCADVRSGQRWENLLLYQRPSQGPLLPGLSEDDLPPVVPPRALLTEVLKQCQEGFPQDDLFLTSRFRNLPPFVFLTDYLARFRVFQIMPSHARRPASASGTSEMGKNGENLPAALQGLQRESTSAYTELENHLRLAVPTVEKLETGYVVTRELGLYLKEHGIARKMYSSELSDGTLRTIGIFLPLVHPDYPLVVIEEPENCTHPWVTREFVLACREHAESKQILLTTHSPVLVSGLKVEELLVVEKERGETQLKAAKQMEDALAVVSEGIMDLGEYWDSGAMGGVPVQLTLFNGGE